ncbi:MAG: restriction endonuclease subunit S [Verrucomicrobia bacterium]|nr:restriction endonuclease subunit S [Verrucomicrobiota bacterium]
MVRATDVDAGTIRTDNLLRVDPAELPLDRNPYLKADEIIVVRSGAYTGDSAIVPPALEGAVAGYDMVVTVTRSLPHFVAYGLLSKYVLEDQLLLLTLRAAQPHLNSEELGSIVLAMPSSRQEQQRIVAYLDASCAAIDAAVAAKRHQIEILGAMRTEAIHRAVTCGLNPRAKLKASGVEWFDKIPMHWEVDRLKDVVGPNRDAIKVGPFGSDLLLGNMADGGIKVYNQRTVIDRDFDSGIHFISEEKYSQMKAFTVYPRDLLITTRGTIGRCAIVPETARLGILHPCLMRVQTNKSRMLPEYLGVLIQDCALVLRQLQMMSASTTIDVIYSNSLKRTCLPVPPVREQQEIISYLARKDAVLRALAAKIDEQITTLTAYRKSLIHECVTGQRRISDADLEQVRKHE